MDVDSGLALHGVGWEVAAQDLIGLHVGPLVAAAPVGRGVGEGHAEGTARVVPGELQVLHLHRQVRAPVRLAMSSGERMYPSTSPNRSPKSAMPRSVRSMARPTTLPVEMVSMPRSSQALLKRMSASMSPTPPVSYTHLRAHETD